MKYIIFELNSIIQNGLSEFYGKHKNTFIEKSYTFVYSKAIG